MIALPDPKVGQVTPTQGDTVEVLVAAFLHHFAEVKLDSAAVAVETDVARLPESVLQEVAARLNLPTARDEEVRWCAEEITYPLHCELRGVRYLVWFRISSIEANGAVVSVSAWTEWTPGRVDGSGTEYELERTGRGWIVSRALMSWAT